MSTGEKREAQREGYAGEKLTGGGPGLPTAPLAPHRLDGSCGVRYVITGSAACGGSFAYDFSADLPEVL